MTQPVRQHFCLLNGRWGVRQVHYRRAGEGPLVLLMHQSPQSSRELLPTMHSLADRYTVVAPDMPGYGLSDPLGVSKASLEDLAEATIEFTDALGAGRFAAYGFHTGGMLSVAMADRYPDRVTAAACNGVVILTDAERDDILANYFPPFEPRWDGSHLAWLWARMREQLIFFPWYRRTGSARMQFPVSPPDQLQAGALEFLRAAEHYAVAYRAAFRFDGATVLKRVRVPVLLTAAAWDPLQPHLQRIEQPSASVRAVPADTPDDALALAIEHVGGHSGDPLPVAGPGVASSLAVTDRLRNGWLDTGHGFLRGRVNDRPGDPVVVLHGAGGSSVTAERMTASLARAHRVVAIDLPGHGESVYPTAGDGPTVTQCADAVQGALQQTGVERLSLLGLDGGGLIALELASRLGARVRRLVLSELPILSDTQRAAFREYGMPSLKPAWHGGHWLEAWHMVRDARLFFPWFQREPSAILMREPDLDEGALQTEVTELFKADGAWQRLLADQLDWPLDEALNNAPGRTQLCAVEPGPLHDAAREAAAKYQLELYSLPAEPGRRAEVFARCLA